MLISRRVRLDSSFTETSQKGFPFLYFAATLKSLFTDALSVASSGINTQASGSLESNAWLGTTVLAQLSLCSLARPSISTGNTLEALPLILILVIELSFAG